ncbi:hypothetical protein C6V83_09950 [Gordonia iterans]|uniref:DUF1990 domain-containing protein n=1 Tax=Gordonia iterans TaxID=1004901 RepID=A0A2S0KFU4_9ACTN|nr:DUF1990 domain-containing protein [Gordonia iterans]AVM00545.1 hypothetical protein C6V83_09950 [Gordonia iterans]
MLYQDLSYPTALHGASVHLCSAEDPVECPDVHSGDAELRKLLAYNRFHVVTHCELIGGGRHVFEHAAARLLSGAAHRAARAPLRRSDRPAARELEPGERVEVRPFGLGAAASPCRVLVAEYTPRRADLVYGTLPGHLECGEERFSVVLGDDDAVIVEVVAFSRPGRPITRIAGPLGRRLQQAMARRYVRAIGDLTGSPAFSRSRNRNR